MRPDLAEAGRSLLYQHGVGLAFLATVRAEGRPPAEDHALFRLRLDSCLLTRTTGHGDPAPAHHVWRDDEQSGGFA